MEFLKITPKIKTLYVFYLKGAFFNVFLPGSIGGDVVRTKYLIKEYNLKIKESTFITIAERIVGLYSLLVVLFVSLLLKLGPISNIEFIGNNSYWLFIVMLFIILLLVPISKFLLEKVNINFSYQFAISTILILFLSQFGDILIAFIFSIFFHLDIPLGNFLFIMPIVYLATVLPISLGGLGVREGTFAGLMSLYGVDISTSILVSFSMYLVKLIVGLVGASLYLRSN